MHAQLVEGDSSCPDTALTPQYILHTLPEMLALEERKVSAWKSTGGGDLPQRCRQVSSMGYRGKSANE